MYTLWAGKCLCYSGECEEAAAAGQASSQEEQEKTITSHSEGPRIPSHIHRHPSALNLPTSHSLMPHINFAFSLLCQYLFLLCKHSWHPPCCSIYYSLFSSRSSGLFPLSFLPPNPPSLLQSKSCFFVPAVPGFRVHHSIVIILIPQ